MPAASITPHNNSKMTTIVLVIAVIFVGAVVGFLALTRSGSFDTRNRAQDITVANQQLTPKPDAAADTNTGQKNDTGAPTIAQQPSPKSDVQPSGTICKEEGSICSWISATTTGTYKFQIIDSGTGSIIKEGSTSDTKVSFTPLINHSYTCIVTAVNACGESPQAKGSNTCSVSITPTVSISVTPTITTKPSPTPTKVPGCDTPNQCIPSSQCKPGTQVTGASCGSGLTCCMPQVTSTPTTAPTIGATTAPQMPRSGMFEAPLIMIGISIAVIALGLVL